MLSDPSLLAASNVAVPAATHAIAPITTPTPAIASSPIVQNAMHFSIQIPKEKAGGSTTAVSQEKKPRRARTNSNDRNYICGCGKSYLSYPALYTHIKQKHHGQTQQGTMKPEKSKRARSQKTIEQLNDPTHQQEIPEEGAEYEDDNEDELDDEEEDEYDDNMSNSAEDPERIIEDLVMLIYAKLNQDGSIILLESQQNTLADIHNAFPLKAFEDSQQGNLGPLIQPLQQFYTDDPMEEIENNGVLQTSCNRVLSLFIIEVSRHLKGYALQEVILYTCWLRRAINQVGAQVLQTLGLPYNYNGEFCAVNSAYYVPHMFNTFLLDKLPEYLQQSSIIERTCKLINLKEVYSTVVQLTSYFNNWLFAKRYTNLIVNEDNIADTK